MVEARSSRIKQVLARRQMDLTVCLEHVHKPQNVAAVLRTCDAVGIHEFSLVWNAKTYFRRGTAMGSQKWLKHIKHDSIETAHEHFKQQDMQVVVTNLSDKSVDYREVDYTRPTAIIMGQEKYGATEEAIALADHQVVIPMMGMVQSLNVSVAAALVLYEAQHQRQRAGMYEQNTMPDEVCNAILFEGCHPVLYKQCVAKGLPFPTIDDNGDVIADKIWWQKMQMTEEAAANISQAENDAVSKNDLINYPIRWNINLPS